MAEKKITKREVINSMLANEVIASNEMYVAYLQNELALLDKKAERKGKSADEVAQVNAIKSAITETLATIGKGTVTEIQKANSELSELSNQKVTSLLKALKEEGVVIRATEGRKTIFFLA
jgi:histidinol-phosphate/aromatic aminotransferase/cobyric acid decarboxylase-like protein